MDSETVKGLERWLLGTWAVGYRFGDGSQTIIGNRKQSFKMILPSKQYGYADPFALTAGGKHYIFVEMEDKYNKHGSIGVCCIEDGAQVRQIIKEPFHMSYPNVFAWNGRYYLIPETHEANALRLYAAEDFPYRWKFVTNLIEGINVVDFSFFRRGDDLYGIAQDIKNDCNNNRYFVINMQRLEGREIFPEKRKIVNERCGGNFFCDQGEWVLPVQECGRIYGEYLRFVSTRVLNENEIIQEECFEPVDTGQIVTDRHIRYHKMHTYNRCGGFEVIDCYFYQFSIKKYILKLLRILHIRYKPDWK